MFAVERFSSISCLPGTRIRRKSRSCRRLARQIVLTIDRILRDKLGIFEFCPNPDCAIRISEARTRTGDRFPDGTPIPQDTKVIELHIWNEHVETLLAGKVSLVRAKILQREMRHSLHYLAQYVCSDPNMADIVIIHGRLVMPIGGRLAQFEELARMYGFSVTVSEARGMGKLHNYFEDCLVHALLWTFNPCGFGRKQEPLRRLELWMGRNQLLERYLDIRDLDTVDGPPMEDTPVGADSLRARWRDIGHRTNF